MKTSTSENHDAGDEDRFNSDAFTWCPFCGLMFRSWRGWCTPVLKPLEWVDVEAKPLSPAERSCDEIIVTCGHQHCRVKAEDLARRLAENLQCKLDKRRYNLIIKEAQDRAEYCDHMRGATGSCARCEGT